MNQEPRIVEVFTDREKKTALFLRSQYFDTPQEELLQDENHIHLVLYDGTEIAGYAHFQFLPENRAILRVLIIDEPYRYQGLGCLFLKLCERWLIQQGVKILCLHSSREAQLFYLKSGYCLTPFDDPVGLAKNDEIELAKILEKSN